MLAFGVTAEMDMGKTTLGEGAISTDNDNDGELEGRPEFRWGDGEDKGSPIDAETGATGDILDLITCAAEMFGVNAKMAASNADAERLMC